MKRALVDNDVLLKLCIYSLHSKLLSDPICGIEDMACLGVAQYYLPKIVAKKKTSLSESVAFQNISDVLQQINVVEPTPEEMELAAALESMANEKNLPLDIGESQLCAIVVLRSLDYLLTGDKRAISAISKLISTHQFPNLAGKLVCLEQLFLHWLSSGQSFDEIRKQVCAEPDCDKSLSLCFSCRSKTTNVMNCMEGLKSYINNLHATAPDVLVN